MSEQTSFGTLSIAHDERVLRPRPWTEQHAAWAADLMRAAPSGPVLELCCGAGQIGLLAVAESDRELVCVDLDPVACEFTARNADSAGLGARVEVRCGSLGEAVPRDERYALVIADPPWLCRSHVTRFPQDPVLAVDGGFDGLDVVRECVRVIERVLLPGGFAVLQLGTRAQAETVRRELLDDAREVELVEVRELTGGVLVRLDTVLGL